MLPILFLDKNPVEGLAILEIIRNNTVSSEMLSESLFPIMSPPDTLAVVDCDEKVLRAITAESVFRLLFVKETMLI